MVKDLLLFSTLLLVALSASGRPQPLVELTIKERGSVDRESEPVTSGIPLPPGRVENVDHLNLLDHEGNPLEVDIQAVNRWWKSDSLKWIHLTFQASLPASGEQKFTLVKQNARRASKTGLQVDENNEQIDVDTGSLRFSIRKRGFNGIAEAWLEGKQLLRSHEGGLVMGCLRSRCEVERCGNDAHHKS